MWISIVPHPPCDDYQVHQYLWCYFPNRARDEPRPFLFRVDCSRIVMLSAARPATQCVQIPLPEQGRVYQFSVLTSPLLGTWRDADGRRHRRGSYPAAAQRGWLERRIEGAGVMFCTATERPLRVFRDARGHRVTVPEVEFSGALLVTDADAFKKTLLRGVGGRGAWGHGLLFLPELFDAAA
jgi:CRISPR-associated protein Cas6/Cse3/CasE subtype I-E